MAEKKMGPKEAAQRAMREASVAQNKKLIDKHGKVKAKSVGKVTSIKAAQRGR